MKSWIPITVTVAGLIALGCSKAEAKDIYEEMAEKGFIKPEHIQVKRAEAFNAFDLVGVTRDSSKIIDLRDASFREFLNSKHRNQGVALYNFLNQPGAEHFGVVSDRDNHMFVYSIPNSRLIASTDSVESRFIEVPPQLGMDINTLARYYHPSLSLIYKIKSKNLEIRFKIQPTDFEFVMKNIGEILESDFGFNVMYGDKIANKSAQDIGLEDALGTFYQYDDGSGRVVRLLEDFENEGRGSYIIEGDKAKIVLGVASGNRQIVRPIPNIYDLPKLPRERVDFGKGEDLQRVGLEPKVLAAAQTPSEKELEGQVRRLGVVGDSDKDGLSDEEERQKHGTDPLKYDSDGDGFPDGEEVKEGSNPLDPKSKPKKAKPAMLNIVVGGGVNPVRGMGGIQRNSGDWTAEAYVGASVPGKDYNPDPFVEQPDPRGNHAEIERVGDEGSGLFVGGDVGYRLASDWYFIAGGDLGVYNISGKAFGRQFDPNGKVIRRDPDQVINDTKLRKRLGLGLRYKGVSGRYNYNLDIKQHDFQFTFPISRRNGGNKK